jgi:AraC-like DNA-binding protein
MEPVRRIRAWRPGVPGVAEVLHARFSDHAYPMHTHDTWTVLVVESGTIRYELEHHEHGVRRPSVTVLPPHVAHDGRAATPDGFFKRVLYLEAGRIDVDLVGRAVDHPGWDDPTLRAEVDRVHQALAHPGDELEAESRLALVTERLARHLAREEIDVVTPRAPALVARLRELLDSRAVDGITLEEASRLLEASPTHLVRAFRRETGIPPHRYLVGRRLDAARRQLLRGDRPVDVAAAVGFYDQAHLTRHFRQLLGVTPGQYVASARG